MHGSAHSGSHILPSAGPSALAEISAVAGRIPKCAVARKAPSTKLNMEVGRAESFAFSGYRGMHKDKRDNQRRVFKHALEFTVELLGNRIRNRKLHCLSPLGLKLINNFKNALCSESDTNPLLSVAGERVAG